MVKFEVAVEINRPVDEVFAYMTDPTKTPEWNSIVEEARPSETPVRRGTIISTRARFLGRKLDLPFEVVEHVPNKTFVQRTDKPFPFTLTTVFEAAGKGTRVKQVFEGEPGGFFKVGEPILARIAKKQNQALLDTVKELLEARTPPKSVRTQDGWAASARGGDDGARRYFAAE